MMLIDDWVEEIGEARVPRGYGGRFYGAYPAVVRDIKDPDGQGRVKVALPWSNRASAKEELGDHDGAISDATHAIDRDPKCADAWGSRSLARAQIEQDRLE